MSLITWDNPPVGFLHIPKTGGRSVKTIFQRELSPNDHLYSKIIGGHYPLSELIQAFDLSISKLDTIYATVRNPYQRVVSEYNWYYQGLRDTFMRDKFLKIQPNLIEMEKMNFKEFIDWYWEKMLSYKDFLFVNGEFPSMVKLIRLETLQDSLKNIFWEIKNIPHIYNMHNRHYSEYFTKELYEKVNNKYKWCFDSGLYVREGANKTKAQAPLV